jgi:hypothetical protein
MSIIELLNDMDIMVQFYELDRIYSTISMLLAVPLSLLVVELLHHCCKIKRYGVIYSCLFIVFVIFTAIAFISLITFYVYGDFYPNYNMPPYIGYVLFFLCGDFYAHYEMNPYNYMVPYLGYGLFFLVIGFIYLTIRGSTSKEIFFNSVIVFSIPALYTAFRWSVVLIFLALR